MEEKLEKVYRVSSHGSHEDLCESLSVMFGQLFRDSKTAKEHSELIVAVGKLVVVLSSYIIMSSSTPDKATKEKMAGEFVEKFRDVLVGVFKGQ